MAWRVHFVRAMRRIACVLLVGLAPWACAAEPDVRAREQRLDATRTVALTEARELVVRSADGVERVIARDVADPRVRDGRIAFTQLPPGREIAPDTVGTLVVLDLARGTRWTVDADPTDSSPFLVPGSDEVVFVSSRSGMASLFVARPGAPPRRLTNAGVRSIDDPRWVPVPGDQLDVVGRDAVFTARYGGVASRWRVDLDTGAAERLP